MQDLKEALRIKEMEIEELKEARGHLPTDVSGRMHNVQIRNVPSRGYAGAAVCSPLTCSLLLHLTQDADLLEGYKRMREVFDNLRSTLSCSLCYESFKPNDVLTLECGHTMCREYVSSLVSVFVLEPVRSHSL